MMKCFVLALLCFSGAFVHADFVVLKNGKQLKIDGSYEVKGDYIVFKNESGEVLQLPANIVDFDRSSELTEAYLAKLEAEKNRRPKKPVQKGLTMAEIAEIVEGQRAADQPAPEVSIQTKGLEEYGTANPRPEFDAVPFEPSGGEFTPEAQLAKRRSLNKSYEKLAGELEDLNQRIEQAERFATALDQESAFGDDPTGTTYEAMDTAYKQVEKLKAQRTELEQQLKGLSNNARQANIKNYKNMRENEKKQADERNR